MEVPTSLNAWTYETVVLVVEHYGSESGRFDYKEVLHAAGQGKGEHAASIRRTTCSMANGDGGYLLFGVKDRAASNGTLEDRIVGIPLTSSLRKEFEEKLAPIQRNVYFGATAIPLRDDATTCIFVVHIPRSNLRPHLDTSDGRFLIRGEGAAAKPMSYFEVRDQMLYTEGRLQKVTLLRFELATFMSVCQMLNNPSTWSVRFDAGAFKVLLADICDMLQPDSGLLALLYGIGSGATILNPLLDREEEWRMIEPVNALQSQAKAELVQDVRERRAQLFNSCAKAQERLAALFGPLKTS